MIQVIIAGMPASEHPSATNLSQRVIAAVNGTSSNAAAIASRCGLSRPETAQSL